MPTHTHEKVVYSVCGCVQRQCRCIEGGQNVRTIPGPCPKHAAVAQVAATAPVKLTSTPEAPRLARVELKAWDHYGELMYAYEAVAAESHTVEVVATDHPGLHRIVVETRDRPSTAATGRLTRPAADEG